MEITNIQRGHTRTVHIWNKYGASYSSDDAKTGRIPDARSKIQRARIFCRNPQSQIYDKINIISNKGSDLNISWQEFILANRFHNPKKSRNSVVFYV